MRPTTSRPDAAVAALRDGQAAAPAPPAAPPRPGRLRGLRKYLKIFRVSLTERLTYRADFFISTVLRFLPLVATIFLWHAVYISDPEQSLQGYTLNLMVAYLLLVQISRMFSSMPGLAFGIARDIRDGNLKKYLLQPIELIPYLLSYRVAHKAAYIVTSALPYGLLFFFCRDYFTLDQPAQVYAAYVLSLLLAFVIGFFFEAGIGMIGFWMLEVTSFLYVVNTVTFFVSGHMFPLDLLPAPWADVLKFLPFKYLAYFPATVFLGKVPPGELWQELLVQAAWAAAFVLLAVWLYRRGLRRYSAYGG
jgi:ABC-2 type transport system permease protein